MSRQIVEANGIFSEFIGQQVKVPYKDGNQFKVARGSLESIDQGFVKITGQLGTIIINEKNIEKMSRVSVKAKVSV